MPEENFPLKLKRKLLKLTSVLDKTNFWRGMALILFGLIILTQLFEISITTRFSLWRNSLQSSSPKTKQATGETIKVDTSSLAQAVLPKEGVVLPIRWGDLGKRMIADGVIDEQKFRALFEEGLTNTEEQMLSGNSDEPIVLTEQNSRFMLDALWAFGLANKNDILENGEMADKEYGGAGNFASTGGWSLARGAAMDHYSKHGYVALTYDQQALVDKVSLGIYRPCCGNSTHFPDCNHGMAMLGLLELMAKNGVGEAEMYKVALLVNSFWFPQTYMDLATYFLEQGTQWADVDAKTVLGAEYSSAQGYQKTRQQIQSLPKPQQGGGGCGA